MEDNKEMRPDETYVGQLNRNIVNLFKQSIRLFFNDPGKVFSLGKTLFFQKRAVKVRMKWKETGLHVPPFMILSITNKCNLQCKGCYASIHHQNVVGTEMDEGVLRRVLSEAQKLGISIVLVAGGEPFSRPEIVEIMKDYPDIIFVVFTNGLLIDDKMVKRLKKIRNIVPVISLEGTEKQTDERRGSGIYAHLQNTIQTLGEKGIINGISFTLTNINFNVVTDRHLLNNLIKMGVNLFFFVEYVPVEEGTEGLIVTSEQRLKLKESLSKYRSELPAIFIAFPGDEEELGGCLAAGRGFIHVNPEGGVEPCPFAPYSDSNLQDLSLKEALKSDLLETIRSNKEILEEAEAGGGCTLWTKRELVKNLLQDNKSSSNKEV